MVPRNTQILLLICVRAALGQTGVPVTGVVQDPAHAGVSGAAVTLRPVNGSVVQTVAASALGAFRFNSGTLMRIGTAARQWRALEPTAAQYAVFYAALDRAARFAGPMELCYSPRDIASALRNCVDEPPATLLVLPNGWIKVAAALPQVCGDLRRDSLADAWRAYCAAWHDGDVLDAAQRAIDDGSRHAEANRWTWLPLVNA